MLVRWATLPLAFGILVASAACGGGGGPASQSPKTTSPDAVPTAAPIQNGVLYQLRGREMLVEGARTSVANGPTAVPQSYTVVSGDSCSAIAEKLGVPLSDLMAANRAINSGCTNLSPGDTLRVPGKASNGGGSGTTPTATPKRGGTRTYTVNSGDTCAGIAQSFDVPVADLIALNNLDAACGKLQVGQILNIPK